MFEIFIDLGTQIPTHLEDSTCLPNASGSDFLHLPMVPKQLSSYLGYQLVDLGNQMLKHLVDSTCLPNASESDFLDQPKGIRNKFQVISDIIWSISGIRC